MRRPREALISARVERGLSTMEAAAAIGMHVDTLRGAEDGNRLQMRTARRLAEFYGRPVAELFPDWAQTGGRWRRNGDGS